MIKLCRYFFQVCLIFCTINSFSQQADSSDRESKKGFETINSGAMVNLYSDDFNRGHINHPYDLIKGRMAGLVISKAGSNPNGFYELRLRGIRTMLGNSSPTVVINGFIGAFPELIDPNDIKSVTLLKDAATAFIYGLSSGTGVLLIETKNGPDSDKILIDYNTSVTLEKVAGRNPAMKANDWRMLHQEIGGGNDFGHNTDWRKEITKTAFSQVHNLSISGGKRNTSYRGSFNYRNGDGIMINTGYSQLNGRVSFVQKAFRQKLIAGFNLGATQRKSRFGYSDAFKYALIYNPTAPVRNSDPSFEPYGGYFQQSLFDNYNPVSIASLNRNQALVNILNLTAHASYLFGNGLTIEFMYGLQNLNLLGVQYSDENELWFGLVRNGFAARQEDESEIRQIKGIIRYVGKLGATGTISLSAGYCDYDTHLNGLTAEGENFNVNNLSFRNLFNKITLSNGLNEISSSLHNGNTKRFYGTAVINLNETLFFDFNGSYDGSTFYGQGNKWHLSGGIIGRVDIMRLFHQESTDNIQIRLGYGTVGTPLNNDYLTYYRLGTRKNLNYIGYNLSEIQTNMNPDLKRQVTKEFTMGFDFRLFRSKLSGSFDLYSAVIHDPILLVNIMVPPNPYLLVNLGRIVDSGIELSIDYSVASGPAFSYNVSMAASYSLANKPVSLSGIMNGSELSFGIKDLGNLGSPGNNGVPLVRIEEGKPFGQLLALNYKGIDEAGNVVIRDVNGDHTIDFDDRIIAGNSLPKFILSLNNAFMYKRWDFNLFFYGIFGHDLVNTYRALYEAPMMVTSYNLPETALEQRNSESQAFQNNNFYSDHHIENASFLSLDNLCIGYTFTRAESKTIKGLRAFIAGNNLFYITNYKGIDPNPRYGDSGYNYNEVYDQIIPGIDRTDMWYRSRSVTLGVNVLF